MTFTNHVIERFQERITSESPGVIRSFIESEIRSSISLYRIKNIEKRLSNGVIYVLDMTDSINPKVITLYLQ